MGTTAEKLAYLSETKTEIKNAIVAKGVEVPEGTTFRGYADLIAGISAGESITLETGTVTPVSSGKFYAYTFTIPIEGEQALFVCVNSEIDNISLFALSLPDGSAFDSASQGAFGITISRSQSSVTVSGFYDDSRDLKYYYAKIMYNN